MNALRALFGPCYYNGSRHDSLWPWVCFGLGVGSGGVGGVGVGPRLVSGGDVCGGVGVGPQVTPARLSRLSKSSSFRATTLAIGSIAACKVPKMRSFISHRWINFMP